MKSVADPRTDTKQSAQPFTNHSFTRGGLIMSNATIYKILMLSVAITSSLYAGIHNDRGCHKNAASSLQILPLKSLNETIESIGKHVSKQFTKNHLVPNPGRQSLVAFMVKEPHQIIIDLPRMPIIRIGDAVVPSRTGQSPQAQFSLVGTMIENYVKRQPLNLRHRATKGRAGRFWTAEIIYAMAQTFSAPAQIEAYNNEEILTNGEWGAESGNTRLSISIVFSSTNPSSLVVSTITEKDLTHLKKGRDKKMFITKANVIFDLATGDVKYQHYYNVGGKTKYWFTCN
jgi:hypothetical protein